MYVPPVENPTVLGIASRHLWTLCSRDLAKSSGIIRIPTTLLMLLQCSFAYVSMFHAHFFLFTLFMLTSHFGYVTTLYHFAYVRFYLFMLILLVIMSLILQYIILLRQS